VSRVIDEHRLYLSDAARVSAFASAIAEVVRPGDVVLDLASGTGILGLLACRAGASRVYAIDDGGMAQPARAIARANGFEDRIRVINGFSEHVDLPERATVLVTDQIGRFGFDAGAVGSIADARRRLLTPDARLVPSQIDLLVAPVEVPDVADAVDFWTRRPAGFDMEPLHEMTANSGHPRTLDASHLLGALSLGGSIDCAAAAGEAIGVSAEIAISRSGTLHGIGGWFSARLSPSVSVSNSPLAADRIARRGVVFPIRRGVAVAAGDRVTVRMHILPGDLIVSWTVQVFRGTATQPAERFDHSTLRGMLIEPARLRRTRPDYVPHLTGRGKARLSVLELCDGRRPLAAIERDVFERHPSLFRDRAEAAVFVAEVVTGYSE
jgi:Ribosomal protein L11 methyltransferase (PrmA)